MKKLTKVALSLMAVGAMSAGYAASDKSSSDSDINKDQLSYSIGYTMGENIGPQLKMIDKQAGIELDKSKIQSGFEAGVDGKKPSVSKDDMQKAMQAFQQKMQKAMQKQMKQKQQQDGQQPAQPAQPTSGDQSS